jgi:sugar phosphate isomerase/epimerase
VALTAHDLTWPDLIWSHFSRPRYGAFDERLAAAAAAGFLGIGLYAPEYQRLRQEEGRSAKDIRTQLEDHGLVVAEIEALRGWSSPPGTASADCLAFEEVAYEMADELGCRYLQAVGPYEGTLSEAAEGFGALCDRAGAHGLLVGVEFLPFTNVRTAADAKALIDAADRPNGGCCVDIWHHKRGADDEQQIRDLTAERIMNVQMDDGPLTPTIDDYREDCLTYRVPPGEGDFDCVGFVRLLDDIGVQCPIAVEVCSAELWAAPAEEAARRAAEGMRAVLAEAGVTG